MVWPSVGAGSRGVRFRGWAHRAAGRGCARRRRTASGPGGDVRPAGAGVGGRQGVELLAGQAGAAPEVGDVGIGLLLAGGLDAQPGGFLEALDLVQAQAHGRAGLAGQGFERGFPAALGDVDRQHPHAVAAGVLHQLRGGVKAHGLGIQQRGQKGFGLMAFEPGAGIGQLGEAGGMAFRKHIRQTLRSGGTAPRRTPGCIGS